MQCITNKFEFIAALKPYMNDNLPNMEEIRLEPQVSMLKRENITGLHSYMFDLFKELNDSFKIKPEFKLTENEIIELSLVLIEKYFHYRVQDFAIFVKNAKEGKYGKSYNRLDVPMIHEWIGKYDYDRDGVIENNHLKAKDNDGYERKADTLKISDDPEFRKIASEHAAKQIQKQAK